MEFKNISYRSIPLNDNHQVQGGAGAGNGRNEERPCPISRLAQADQATSLPFPGKWPFSHGEYETCMH